MRNKSCNIEIKEAYKNFTPCFSSTRIVRRMLSHVPEHLLGGLRTVVLTNSGSLNHDRKRGKTRYKKKKVNIKDCQGLYHEKWNGESAWIELFIDNIEYCIPGSISWLPPVQDNFYSKVLYHEIGHHIHKTKFPKHTEPENEADNWKRYLSRRYYHRRYWYLIPFAFLLFLILKPFEKFLHNLDK